MEIALHGSFHLYDRLTSELMMSRHVVLDRLEIMVQSVLEIFRRHAGQQREKDTSRGGHVIWLSTSFGRELQGEGGRQARTGCYEDASFRSRTHCLSLLAKVRPQISKTDQDIQVC